MWVSLSVKYNREAKRPTCFVVVGPGALEMYGLYGRSLGIRIGVCHNIMSVCCYR